MKKLMMRRNGLFLLGAVCGLTVSVCSLGLSGCGGGGKDAVTRIQENGSFRVAFGDLSDMALADGEQAGEMALAETIGAELGVTVEFLPAESSQAALALVAEGSADAALGAVTEAMAGEAGLSVSIPYGEDKLYVVTRRGDYSDSPGAFSGRSIGVLPSVSAAAESIASGDETVQAAAFTDGGAGTRALLSQSIDGLVCSYPEGIALLEAYEGQLQMQNLQNTAPQEYVIAVNAGENRLISGINTMIGRQIDGGGTGR